MKLPLLCCCLLLPACALGTGAGGEPDWRQLQRQRLQQLFAREQLPPPSPVQYVRPSAQWHPASPESEPVSQRLPPPQEPQQPQQPIGRRPGERAIDDVEPAVGGRQATGFRDAMGFRDADRATGPPHWVRLTTGAGRFEFHAKDTQLHDAANALYLDLDIGPEPEHVAGIGLDLHGFVTEDDLFHGETIYNGQAQKPADAIAYGLGMFPHLALRPLQDPDFEIPLRFGLFVDWTQLRHQEADVRRNWFMFGPRLELEPEYRFWRGPHGSLSVFAHLGGDFGGAQFHESWTLDDDSALTSRWMSELGGGLRWQWRSIDGELGYRYRSIGIGSIDSDLFGGIDRVEMRDQGLFLSFGGRF